jgi:hypothetical protein
VKPDPYLTWLDLDGLTRRRPAREAVAGQNLRLVK